MCFEVVKKFDKPKTAKTDIVVYKTKGRSYRLGLLFRPGFQSSFVYLWNHITKKVALVPKWLDTRTDETENGDTMIATIDEGYHALNELGLGAWFDVHYHSEPQRVYKFIIPKGTLYYENDTELVSEQIVYMGPRKVSISKLKQFVEKYKTIKAYKNGGEK